MPKEQYSNIMELKRIVSLLAVFLLIFQSLSVFGVSLGNARSPDVQEAGIISESKYYVQGEYPVCSDGKITEPCKCGEKAYSAGFCCRGIWFDPYYENIFSNNTCPSGNFYFVDQNHPNASDDNPGTEELPWKSARYGAQQLQPGDILFIKEGIYYYYTGSRAEPGITPIRSGTSEAPIVIKAYPNHNVYLLSGPTLNCPEDQMTNPAIGAYHVDWIIIDGFKVNGRINIWGEPDDPAEHVIVQNCEVWGGYGADTNINCIRVEHASNCIIRNNILHDNEGTINNSGITFYDVTDTIVEHNEIYNTTRGIYAKDSCFRNKYRYNSIHDCSNAGWHGSGNVVLSQKDEIYQNIFYNCKNSIVLDDIMSGVKIYNNVIYQAAGDPPYHGIQDEGDNSEHGSFEVWNNIISDVQYVICANKGIDNFLYSNYNAFYHFNGFTINYNSKTLTQWRQESGFDLASIDSNPLFLNPTSHNFHLQPSSPCLNAGIDRQDYDNDGNTTEPINMGAYITGNETIGLIDLSQYIVEESQPTSCASQNGVCCNENQICQNGTFISSSDCGNLCCTGECVSPSILGDLNQDNKVNSLDFQILIQKFKETQNIETEDLNSDGIVDIKDIGILMHYWNE